MLVNITYYSLTCLNAKRFQFATENGCKTIVTKDPRYQYKIGTATGLSFNDIKLANLLYNCSGKDTNSVFSFLLASLKTRVNLMRQNSFFQLSVHCVKFQFFQLCFEFIIIQDTVKTQLPDVLELCTLISSCSLPDHCENADFPCPGEGFRGKDCKCYCKGNPIKECDTSGNGEDTGKSVPCFFLVLLTF